MPQLCILSSTVFDEDFFNSYGPAMVQSVTLLKVMNVLRPAASVCLGGSLGESALDEGCGCCGVWKSGGGWRRVLLTRWPTTK